MSAARAGAVLRAMQRLPRIGLDVLAPGTALILAPHPDDESLGCGGLIASACARGRPPVVVVVTDGTGSHPGSPSHGPARLRALREAETREAARRLGLPSARVHFLGLPDTRAPRAGGAFDRAVRRVAALARRYGATTLFATWRHDPHCDHEATGLIGAAAARRAGTALRLYPVWGWLLPPSHPLPRARVSGGRLAIAPHLARKRRAIAAHASQHAGLIADDPDGFRLPPALLAACERPYEVFLTP